MNFKVIYFWKLGFLELTNGSTEWKTLFILLKFYSWADKVISLGINCLDSHIPHQF